MDRGSFSAALCRLSFARSPMSALLLLVMTLVVATCAQHFAHVQHPTELLFGASTNETIVNQLSLKAKLKKESSGLLSTVTSGKIGDGTMNGEKVVQVLPRISSDGDGTEIEESKSNPQLVNSIPPHPGVSNDNRSTHIVPSSWTHFIHLAQCRAHCFDSWKVSCMSSISN